MASSAAASARAAHVTTVSTARSELERRPCWLTTLSLRRSRLQGERLGPGPQPPRDPPPAGCLRCPPALAPHPAEPVRRPPLPFRRNVIHPRRTRAQRVPGKARDKWEDDPGGPGTLIVREITCCPDCAED